MCNKNLVGGLIYLGSSALLSGHTQPCTALLFYRHCLGMSLYQHSWLDGPPQEGPRADDVDDLRNPKLPAKKHLELKESAAAKLAIKELENRPTRKFFWAGGPGGFATINPRNRRRLPAQVFHQLDKELFRGVLKDKVHLAAAKFDPSQHGITCAAGTRNERVSILLDDSILKQRPEVILASLVHHMAHAYFLVCCGYGHDEKSHDLGHGLPFSTLLYTIQARFLPEDQKYRFPNPMRCGDDFGLYAKPALPARRVVGHSLCVWHVRLSDYPGPIICREYLRQTIRPLTVDEKKEDEEKPDFDVEEELPRSDWLHEWNPTGDPIPIKRRDWEKCRPPPFIEIHYQGRAFPVSAEYLRGCRNALEKLHKKYTKEEKNKDHITFRRYSDGRVERVSDEGVEFEPFFIRRYQDGREERHWPPDHREEILRQYRPPKEPPKKDDKKDSQEKRFPLAIEIPKEINKKTFYSLMCFLLYTQYPPTDFSAPTWSTTSGPLKIDTGGNNVSESSQCVPIEDIRVYALSQKLGFDELRRYSLQRLYTQTLLKSDPIDFLDEAYTSKEPGKDKGVLKDYIPDKDLRQFIRGFLLAEHPDRIHLNLDPEHILQSALWPDDTYHRALRAREAKQTNFGILEGARFKERFMKLRRIGGEFLDDFEEVEKLVKGGTAGEMPMPEWLKSSPAWVAPLLGPELAVERERLRLEEEGKVHPLRVSYGYHAALPEAVLGMPARRLGLMEPGPDEVEFNGNARAFWNRAGRMGEARRAYTVPVPVVGQGDLLDGMRTMYFG